MIRHKLFSGLPAYYTDSESGAPVMVGDRLLDDDDLNNDRELNLALRRATLELCAGMRAKNERIESWLLDEEDAALRNLPDSEIINICRNSLKAIGVRIPDQYRPRFCQALLRQQGVAA